MILNKTKVQIALSIFITICVLSGTVLGFKKVIDIENNKTPARKPDIINIIDTETDNMRQIDPQFGIAAGGGLIFKDQKELDQYFKVLEELGVKWIRFDIDWHVIQVLHRDTFDWSGTDRVVETAERHGIEILGTIAYTPVWATDPRCDNGFGCPPLNTSDFARFVRVSVFRYKNSIDHWEIWNEQNSVSYWGVNSTVEQYVEILKASYEEIKKIDPESVVMVGGLAVTGEVHSSPYEYMKKLYELEANRYFDAIAIHPYTYPFAVDSTATWNGWLEIEKIHQLTLLNDEGNKKVWITEFGAPTNGPGSEREIGASDYVHHYDFMSEPAQAEILKTSVSLYKQQSSYMGPYFWYSLVDRRPTVDSTENFFGLMDYYGKEKVSYSVFREAIR